jgi:hypothetical protein
MRLILIHTKPGQQRPGATQTQPEHGWRGRAFVLVTLCLPKAKKGQ